MKTRQTRPGRPLFACLLLAASMTECDRGEFGTRDFGAPDAAAVPDGGRGADATADALEVGDVNVLDSTTADALDAISSGTLDALGDIQSLSPNCAIKVTDVTALLNKQVSGRLESAAGVSKIIKVWDERIAARTPLDHFVLFERIAGNWSVSDLTSLNPPNTASQNCPLTTVRPIRRNQRWSRDRDRTLGRLEPVG